jgi:hypothetical protein
MSATSACLTQARLATCAPGKILLSPGLCDLATDPEACTEGRKLGDRRWALDARLLLNLPHEVFELGGHVPVSGQASTSARRLESLD